MRKKSYRSLDSDVRPNRREFVKGIGAVSAIGCFDLGLKASGLPEDFEN